jgi:hypothetical protein
MTYFYAVQDGEWASGFTWGHGGTTPGIDYPGNGDTGDTNGYSLTVTYSDPTLGAGNTVYFTNISGSCDLTISTAVINGTFAYTGIGLPSLYPLRRKTPPSLDA